MRDVVERERAAASILQPLLCGLIPADLEVPRQLRHVFEIMIFVDVDVAALSLRVAARHHVVPASADAVKPGFTRDVRNVGHIGTGDLGECEYERR